VTRFLAIYDSCEISRDPDQNTANHQALVDSLNAMTAADGWDGVKVVSIVAHCGRTNVGIEPGRSPLTLEYLRRMKEAGKDTPTETVQPVLVAEQGRLL
jgi:hypothetical protein